MTLTSPALLVLGLLVVAALVVAAVVAARRRAAALAAIGAAPAHGRARRAGIWFTIAGIAVLAVAVAGPAASVPVPRTSGTVILAIDTSNSMGATDVTPTRLVAAQKAARQFIASQPPSVDVGVVAFQTGALTTAQPTADHSAAEDAVGRLRVSGGTSLGAAITASLSAITGKTVAIPRNGALPKIGYWGSATIVIYSDGQDEGDSAETNKAAQLAEKAGVHIDTVGVGTAQGTSVKVDGFLLQTALDEDALTQIAQTTSGAYHPATDASQLDHVADTIDLRLTVANIQFPLAGPFIVLAIALLAIGAVLTVARSGRVV